MGEITLPEDMVRNAAMAVSLFEPTGIVGVVAAYTYPKCSRYWENPEETQPLPVVGDQSACPCFTASDLNGPLWKCHENEGEDTSIELQSGEIFAAADNVCFGNAFTKGKGVNSKHNLSVQQSNVCEQLLAEKCANPSGDDGPEEDESVICPCYTDWELSYETVDHCDDRGYTPVQGINENGETVDIHDMNVYTTSGKMYALWLSNTCVGGGFVATQNLSERQMYECSQVLARKVQGDGKTCIVG